MPSKALEWYNLTQMHKDTSKYKLVYAHLWQIYGQSWYIRISYLLQIASRICKFVLLPIALSLIITHMTQQDYDGARQAVLYFVAASLALGILSPLAKYIGMLGENQAYRRATGHYFSQLIHTDVDFFHDNLSGYLTTAVRHYVDSGLQLVRTMRDVYISTVLTIILPLCIIAWINWQLGLIAFGLSVAQAGFIVWSSRLLDPHRKKSRELYKQNSGKIADIVSNIVAVRATGQESAYVQKVKRGAKEEADAFTERFTLQAKLTGAREFITVIFFMVMLWLTVTQISTGEISITAAVLVVTYIATILSGIYALSEDLNQHDDFIDKILPAFDVLQRTNVVADPAKPVKFQDIQGVVQLNEVKFSYHKDTQCHAVFDGLSLDIPSGQKIGVVGLSGAGKSTLTKLLLRFNDVDSGMVMIDGINIKNISQKDLHRAIAYVPQEPLLFHTSIKDNVLVARPDATDADIHTALKAAHATDFIADLPNGLDSIVGERGVKLSGGQKQRIAIARAVLQNAPIMILDEATSALDSESEQIIKESFSDVLRGKTAVVVAHRLSTLSEMNRIIVIDKGKIAEDGTHEELLGRGKLYAKLWYRQQRHLEA